MVPQIGPPTGIPSIAREISDVSTDFTVIGNDATDIKDDGSIIERHIRLESVTTGAGRGFDPERRTTDGNIVIFDPNGDRHNIIRCGRVDERSVGDQSRGRISDRDAKVKGSVASLTRVTAATRC